MVVIIKILPPMIIFHPHLMKFVICLSSSFIKWSFLLSNMSFSNLKSLLLLIFYWKVQVHFVIRFQSNFFFLVSKFSSTFLFFERINLLFLHNRLFVYSYYYDLLLYKFCYFKPFFLNNRIWTIFLSLGDERLLFILISKYMNLNF